MFVMLFVWKNKAADENDQEDALIVTFIIKPATGSSAAVTPSDVFLFA